MGHGHAHDHGTEGTTEGAGGHHGHAHDHGVRPDADCRFLVAGLAVLATFMVSEVVVALLSGSVALLADAGHMLSDVAALLMAVGAMTLAARPVDSAYTFGRRRAEIVAAALNGVTLLVVGVLLGVQAVLRLIDPGPVHGGSVLAVAAAGVVVNVVVAWLVARANRTSLNVEGAYQHILTDLYAYLATLAAGLVMVVTGWARADALAGLVVVVLMLRAGWTITSAATRILLEATPREVDLAEVTRHLESRERVRGVHDLHAWTITSGLVALSVHVEVDDDDYHRGPVLLDEIQDCLRAHFRIEHATVQIEPVGHADHEHVVH